MDEYISKHEAYTLMKDLEAAYIYPPVKEAYGTAARRIDQMPSTDVQPVDRWISVDDKLPDSDTTVLIWYTADSLFGRFGDYGVTHYRESSGWSKASLIGDNQAIFYWMPLPEPPKEGEY